MSLRAQLLVSIALVLLASLAAGTALVYWHALKKVETEVDAAIDVAARIARNSIVNPGGTPDPRRRLESLVADFEGDRHVRARLIDADGSIAAVSHLLPAESPAPAWFIGLLSGAPRSARLELPEEFDRHGSLVLETDAANELSEAWGDIKLGLTVLGLFSGLVLVLVYWTLGRALAPLNELVVAFDRVGEGDYRHRLAARGALELARLCRGFNRMSERLAEIERQNRRLAEQLLTVEEEERAELARDLHDEIGPLLFAVDVDATAIRELAARGDRDQTLQRIGSLREAVGQIQRHVRGIISRLRLGAGLELGLAHAVRSLVGFWRTRHPNVVFAVEVPEEGLASALEAPLYRIVQESVSNALRHGAPRRIEVDVGADAWGTVTVSVEDDGGGMRGGGHGARFGLLGMRERVAALGGTLAVRDRPDGSGVVVSARFPADRPSPATAAGQVVPA